MHTEQYTDMSIKISRFLLKIAGIWKSANKTEDRQRKFAVFYTMITSTYSMYVNVADIYHNLNDLDVSKKISNPREKFSPFLYKF